jgi:hypothetical protein
VAQNNEKEILKTKSHFGEKSLKGLLKLTVK